MRFMFSTAPMIWREPSACSLVAMFTCARDLVHVLDGHAHLAAARRLLAGRVGGLGHDLVDVLHGLADLPAAHGLHAHGRGHLAVAMFMSSTVCSTSAEADDCLAVAWAIWAMSWLERLTDSLMRRRARPALSASWIPSRVSLGARLGRLHRVRRLRLHLADDLADLLGRLHRALGQLAHLVRDHREAAARARRRARPRWRR